MRKLILIRGPIGAGKSTTVKLLKKNLPKVSYVDMDHFKISIDHTQSSKWREKMAFEVALYLAEKIMQKGRTLIADIHSAKKYQYESYVKLARSNNYEVVSFLLYPTLEICLKRNRKRIIPNIKYQVTDEKVIKYFEKVYKVKNEKVIDTGLYRPKQVLSEIFKSLK